MKVVECERCGSKELLTESGLIVCAYCRTTYIPQSGDVRITETYRSQPTSVASTKVDVSPDVNVPADNSTTITSRKSRTAALVLCAVGLLGIFGLHRFYVGKIGTGILMLLTAGGFLIWFLVDIVVIVSGNFRDKQGRLLTQW